MADNKLLKEMKARITRLYNWSKEQAAQPTQGRESVLQKLWQFQQESNQPTTRYGKVKKLKESAALFNFLSENGLENMEQLHEKVSSLNSDYYRLRGGIVSAAKRIATLSKHLEMLNQYSKNKAIFRQLARLKPGEQEKFEATHRAEIALYRSAVDYLDGLKKNGAAIAPKKWRAEAATLNQKKDALYQQMRTMREEISATERLRKTLEESERAILEGRHLQDRGL